MKIGTQLETDRLIIRHWTLSDQDREFFHFINSDETVRQFYVTRMSREDTDRRLEDHVTTDSKSGLKWAVACLKSTGQPVGHTGLGDVDYETPFTPCIEVGWLFDPKFWGQAFASEAGAALLKHGFEDAGLEEIVAFAVIENQASVAVMERIGMLKVEDGNFEHPGVPDTHAHLRPHVLYSLTEQAWLDQVQST